LIRFILTFFKKRKLPQTYTISPNELRILKKQVLYLITYEDGIVVGRNSDFGLMGTGRNFQELVRNIRERLLVQYQCCIDNPDNKLYSDMLKLKRELFGV
jgi:hypothetical protein